MAAATLLEQNDIVPVSLLISDGTTGLFPQAIIKDDAGNVLTTLDLSHDSNGEYVPASPYSMPNEIYIVIIYIVYTDVGHITESEMYLRDTDIFIQVAPNDYKADISALATEANATINKNEIIIEVDANETKIDSVITTLSTIVADVWGYSTRTLTSFGTLVTDVWSATTRTLTAGTKDAEIDAIKFQTDQIVFIGGDVVATLNGEKVELTTVVENNIKYILGLVQHNQRIKNPVLNGQGNLISGEKYIYADDADFDSDTPLMRYDISITYDIAGLIVQEFKSKRVDP